MTRQDIKNMLCDLYDNYNKHDDKYIQSMLEKLRIYNIDEPFLMYAWGKEHTTIHQNNGLCVYVVSKTIFDLWINSDADFWDIVFVIYNRHELFHDV